MHKKKIWFTSTVLALLFLSTFLHFWKFPEIPNGFYYDEASVGYNAYCIAMTGADEYGIGYPVFFKCFNNYQDPIYIYVLAGMMKIFGPEKWVVRIPGGIFFMLASIAFFFLAAKYVRNRWICLGGAFVFSILPWLFPLSRTGIGGYMPMIMCMIGGCYFMIDALGRHSKCSALLAGIFWALAMYSHQIGRPMGAVLLICLVLSMNKLLLRRMTILALFSSVYLVCMLPMIVYVWNCPASMTARFSGLSVWGDGAPLLEVMTRILERYMEYFSPTFLFIQGDYELRHNAGISGELYVFMAPFIIAGFYFIVRSFKRNPYFRFILFSILSYPLAAVLTMEKMHSTRCMNGAPFWCMLSLLGFYYLWSCKPKLRVVMIAILFFSLIEVSFYFMNYFGKYAVDSRTSFHAAFVETVELSFKDLPKNETLYVSDSVFYHPVDRSFKPYWYAYFLFYGRVAPETYQKTGIPEYICAYDGKISGPGIFIRMNSRIKADADGNPIAVVNAEPIPANSKLIHKIPLWTGSDRFFEIYRVY